jgi:flagellar hook-associated protein 1
MSDIFNISSAAVSAYQRTLGTVSNNIANVGTEGYVRQESKLEENPSALKGNVYLGTGTNFAGVRRAYDEFLEQNLRNSNSDVATQEPLVTYTNRVVDVLGSDTVGLPPAMDKFFASARALSTDPSSTILRGQFLRDTEGLADRFHQLSAQLGAIELETRESINGKIDKINNLSSQLAVVNRQLAGKNLPDLQPPELLDQRDRLLNDLSKLVKISVSTTANGSVNVGIGSVAGSGLILNGQNTLQIGAQFDVADMGRFTIVGDPFGNAEPIIGVGNGELGGLVNFREQVLQPSVEHLDFLAKTLAHEVNTVQRNGIDTHGELGKDLFVITTVDRTDKASGAVTKIDRAAEGLKVAITDTSRIAAGARFRVIENEKNLSGVDAVLSYAPSFANTTNVKPLSQVIKNNPDPSAGIAAPENLLLGQITQGSDNWSLFLDDATDQQQIQIFTRDGRHLIGSPLKDDPEDPDYNVLKSIVKTENGFVPGTTYSKEYLNLSDQSGYKQLNVFYGLKAEPSTHYAQDAAFTNTHSVFPTANFKEVTKGLTIPAGLQLIPTQSYTINGKVLPALSPGSPAKTDTIEASDMVTWLNRATKEMTPAVTASAFTEARTKLDIIDLDKELTINAVQVWKGAGDASADVNNDGIVDFDDFISAINNPPGPTGVSAAIDETSGELVLRNDTGADIKIDNPGVETGNALTVEAKVYKGQLQLISEGEITLGFGPKGKVGDLDPLKSALGEPQGKYYVAILPVVPLNAEMVGSTIPAGLRSIAGSALILNNLILNSLPDTGKDLTASDIATWINAQTEGQMTPAVTVTGSNIVKTPAGLVSLASSLKINGEVVWSGNGSATLEELLTSINSAEIGVSAALDNAGNVVISNDTGDDITFASTGSRNALGMANGTYKGSIQLSSEAEIRMGFTSGGTPAELAKLGLRTGVYIEGPVPEDLLVFVVGDGQGTVSGSFDSSLKNPAAIDAARVDSLRAQEFEVNFTTANRYQVTWKNPANNIVTVLAERDYDPTVGINYQGLQLRLSSSPMKGDKFLIDGNQDGIGNNQNILEMVALESKVVIGGPNGATLSQAYEEQLSKVGNIADQAKVAQAALEVVNQQAIENKDKVSGVSLDSEAADLIRFQQAYQACAKAMQVSSELFDSILQST